MLINSDCLELLKTLENNSIDLILTDPPYNIGFDGGKGWDTVDHYQAKHGRKNVSVF